MDAALAAPLASARAVLVTRLRKREDGTGDLVLALRDRRRAASIASSSSFVMLLVYFNEITRQVGARKRCMNARLRFSSGDSIAYPLSHENSKTKRASITRS